MINNMLKLTWAKDLTGVNLLDSQMSQITDQAIKEVIEDAIANIRKNWSLESPSSPGQPPAVVTGNLDKSIRALRRSAGGLFASSSNAISWTIQVEAEYGAALEFGVPERNLAPRPFLRPAVEQVSNELGNAIKAKLEFAVSKYTVINPFMGQSSYVGSAFNQVFDITGALG